jgi:hypothetical protein
MDEKSDVGRVLFIAQKHLIPNWYQWVAARLKSAAAVVNEHWTAIEEISRWLEPQTPQLVGGKSVVFGTDLIDLLRKSGVQPGRTPAVEIAERQERADTRTSWKRFRRSLGCGGWTWCKYVDGASRITAPASPPA